LVTAAASVLALTACGSSSSPLAGGSSAATSAAGGSSSAASAGSITVGSANFPENVLLAEIYAGALKAKGVNVTEKLNIGSREVYIPALKDGSIDLIPEYNGTLLSYFDKGSSTASSPDAVYAALKAALPQGLTLLTQSTAEDKDTIAVTKATAAKYHLTSIADLAPVAGQLSVGAGPEFKSRQTGLVGLKSVYNVVFKTFKPLDSGGVLTVRALSDGTVDAANIFSTDSSIKTKGFVVLTDPKNLFLAENVVPVLTASKATPTVTAALNAVSAKLTTAILTDLVSKVQVDKQDSVKVAAGFLSANGLA
jgi:osmoprotectant transport system substrate-binding protein